MIVCPWWRPTSWRGGRERGRTPGGKSQSITKIYGKNLIFSTHFECIYLNSPLVLSVFTHLPHSFRVYLLNFSTRFECSFRFPEKAADAYTHAGDLSLALQLYISSKSKDSLEKAIVLVGKSRERKLINQLVSWNSPLVLSVFSHHLHSLRVYFHIFSTRFECTFKSSPLV